MLRGSSTVSLDNKGRLTVPSRYRDIVAGEQSSHLVMTLNPFDPSLYLYPLSEWKMIEVKLGELSDYDKQSRRTKQMVLGYAADCQLDHQRRILVTKELRNYAKIDKQAIILGQGNKFEIWNPENWKAELDQCLGDIGDQESQIPESLKSLSL